MKKKALPYLVLLIACLLTACSNTGNKKQSFNGNYTLEAVSVKAFDTNGKPCVDASGELTIKENAISGTIDSGYGFSLDVQGKTENSGEALGSFVIGGNTMATFTGIFSLAAGQGEWQDELECSGTWTATGSSAT